MQLEKKLVYLPVEILTRELDGKLLLAIELLKGNYRVVIGQQWAIYANIPKTPPGIILFKSHNSIAQVSMARAKAHGFVVAALEEELFGHSQPERIAAVSNAKVYELADIIFCHGKVEMDVHINCGAHPSQLVVSGNPRADALKIENQSIFRDALCHIKQSYGDYILINTNFGFLNSQWGLEGARNIEIQAAGRQLTYAELSYLDEFLRWEQQNAAQMSALIETLCGELPEINVIVRPHPSENLKRARDFYKPARNLHVIRAGSHIPWILGSRMLIHTSCTTGFEAALLRKFAINFVPSKSLYSGSILSARVNPEVDNAESLVALVKTGEIPECHFEDVSSLAPVVYNVGMHSACSTIIDTFDLVGPKLHSFAKTMPAKFESPIRPEILKNKFSLDQGQLSSYLERFRHVLHRHGIKKIRVTELCDSVFLLE